MNQMRILIKHILFTLLYCVGVYIFQQLVYTFQFNVYIYVLVMFVLTYLSSYFYFKIKESLLQLGFFFLSKFFKIGISVISAILFLKSNILLAEPVYFFVLVTYLSYLTFEIIIVLTNLRPVSGE